MPELPVEDVQSYPRPPALEPVPQRITVTLGGGVIVDTTGAYRVLETHHAPTYYLPPDDIAAALTPAPGRSVCEWKGAADYFDVVTPAKTARRAAWRYARPTERFVPIAGYVALYAFEMEACTVGGMPVDPQPGNFYGGWVTPNLQGRIKGAPGTEFW